MSKDVGIPAGLKDLGEKEEDFPTLAGNALKDACSFINPRKDDEFEVIEIFNKHIKILGCPR